MNNITKAGNSQLSRARAINMEIAKNSMVIKYLNICNHAQCNAVVRNLCQNR